MFGESQMKSIKKKRLQPTFKIGGGSAKICVTFISLMDKELKKLFTNSTIKMLKIVLKN